MAILLALGGTVALGLASRAWPLPGLLAEHTGDALYTVAAYLAFALCFPAWSPWRLAALAWLASALVEASQLATGVPWLVALRATRLGGLFLGHGFQWVDLLAYALGALGALALDLGACRSLRRARGGPPQA